MELLIDLETIMADLDILAAYTEAPAPAVTRLIYGEAEVRARAYVRARCLASGLEVREDGLGNLFARWPGREPQLPAVASGSHLDTAPQAGRFAGAVGVVGALEAVRALQRAGFQPRRSLELLVFAGDAPTRFGLGCLAGRALAGLVQAEQLRALQDATGRTLEDWRQAAGLAEPLEQVALAPGHYAAFIELYIEQGPLLATEGEAIGVVRAMAAATTLQLWLHGQHSHAGSTLMLERRDALLAGAEIALAVEAAALATNRPHTVATTSLFQIEPGLVNMIPGHAALTLEVREIAAEPRDHVLRSIDRAVASICARRHVTYDFQMHSSDAPVTCDPGVVEQIVRVCEDLGLPRQFMVSRTYHNSLFMAHLAPTAMIFIPCRYGDSSLTDEQVEPEHILQGIAVLAHSLARLSE
ncbi:hydantoinase/carbamoylase family amidase [Candidatus Viridilinea mediisalina]|uniref:Zn-dependent hydrolase n=1 Tax=Candidatus Viridilinea mediisalina TaxID=2024553 RepID=A0A2A6RPU0_9CHLR|nr:hydantoinase/carbamoylase family amidase [Candidatus Viridilinea mediisalina]PDW04945.1 Zn-dependent hydrolase [Candidatus Viridilinea mediisalina]